MSGSQRRVPAGQILAVVLVLNAFATAGCSASPELRQTLSPLPATTQGAASAPQLPDQPTAEATIQGLTDEMAFVGKLVLSEGSALYRIDVICDEMFLECAGEPRKLTDLPAHYTSPAWSPSGEEIVFASDLDPEVSEVLGVFTLTEWGGARRQLSATGHHPVWSPTGEQVAYATWEGDGRIMLVTPEVDARIAVEKPLASHPHWSPDGTRIAFLADAIGSGNLYVLFLSDQVVNLVADNATGFMQWSPSGKRIAYTATSGDKADLFISSVGESPGSIAEAQRITTDGSVSYPAWSPDGTQLAFVSGKEGNRNIYVAALACTDTEEACQVDARLATDGPDTETNPIWFPDRNHLVYLAGRGSTWRLEMVDLDNLQSRLLVDGLASPSDLDGHIE